MSAYVLHATDRRFDVARQKTVVTVCGLRVSTSRVFASGSLVNCVGCRAILNERRRVSSRWDLQDGIESYLLEGPRPLRAILAYAGEHGVSGAEAMRAVYALCDCGRLEQLNPITYQLSVWNAAQLKGWML